MSKCIVTYIFLAKSTVSCELVIYGMSASTTEFCSNVDSKACMKTANQFV